MSRVLCFSVILIAILLLPVAVTNAQDQLNVSVLSQYYHNWHDRVWDVAVSGDYAYLACGQDGLRVMNMADENSPREVAQLPLAYARALAVDGDFLYLGSEDNGIHIFDISTPSAPREIGQVSNNEASWVHRLRVHGNVLSVCQYEYTSRSGLMLIDISDPTNAHTLWASADIHEAFDIEICGSTAYVATGNLLTYDISDITSPQLINSFYVYDGIVGVALHGDYACLAVGFGGLRILHLPTMQQVGRIDSLTYAYGVRVVDTLAYVHYGFFDCPLAIVNIADPNAPQTLGVYYPPADLLNFTLVGDRAYVADSYHGLRTVDISDPYDPCEVARCSRFGSDIQVVGINGNFAYLQEEFKLKVIDISDMRNPRERGYYETSWPIDDLDIVGNVGYIVSTGYTFLYAVDLSDPDNPSLLGSFTVTDSDVHYRAAFYDHYAYVVENDGLRIVDVSDPRSMQQVGFYSPLAVGNATIAVHDHYAVVQSYGEDLHVLDLTDPLAPRDMASYPMTEWCRALKIADGTLYARSSEHLWVFDFTDFRYCAPLAQVALNPVYGDWSAKGLAVSGKFVYLAGHRNGLRVYDMTDRANPRLSGYCQTPGIALGVAAFGNIAIVADSSNLGFYDCSMALSGGSEEIAVPKMISLLPNYPNPFNATTQISFELPRAEHVQLRIFNPLGQLVSTLVDDMRPAGITRVAWNTTSAGVIPASGVYICQLKAGSFVQTQRMVLIR